MDLDLTPNKSNQDKVNNMNLNTEFKKIYSYKNSITKLWTF